MDPANLTPSSEAKNETAPKDMTRQLEALKSAKNELVAERIRTVTAKARTRLSRCY
jgi:hypothetical protein